MNRTKNNSRILFLLIFFYSNFIHHPEHNTLFTVQQQDGSGETWLFLRAQKEQILKRLRGNWSSISNYISALVFFFSSHPLGSFIFPHSNCQVFSISKLLLLRLSRVQLENCSQSIALAASSEKDLIHYYSSVSQPAKSVQSPPGGSGSALPRLRWVCYMWLWWSVVFFSVVLVPIFFSSTERNPFSAMVDAHLFFVCEEHLRFPLACARSFLGSTFRRSFQLEQLHSRGPTIEQFLLFLCIVAPPKRARALQVSCCVRFFPHLFSIVNPWWLLGTSTNRDRTRRIRLLLQWYWCKPGIICAFNVLVSFPWVW